VKSSIYSIASVAQALRTLPERDFSDTSRIRDFLTEHVIDALTLTPHLRWDRRHYTRNLIDRTPLYELIAICWESGQMSAIHNHQGQRCWMVAPVGRLVVQNYRVISEDLVAGTCRIEKADAVQMNPRDPQAVDPSAPVHRVLNPREFGERAVSVHIYSRPIDECVVYSEETHSCGLVTLSYTSPAGIEGARPEQRF
jgi:hypothetical protein